MNDRIYMSSPDVGQAEEAAVVRAMRSGWIAPLGPDVDAFESELAQKTGRSFAVALSSGTAALHLGLIGLGVRPGTVVITSTMTFVATANAIVYAGAEPFFIDSLEETGNMDPALLESALKELQARGEVVSAIVPVDLLGKAADYTAIESIAKAYGVPVLSDAAESLGASHAGRPAGSFGAAAAISFNGNKIMTTSGGGVLVTDDAEFAARIRYLATQARQPVTHYEHTEIGYNYRLSNILAALGRAQLDRLPQMIERRRHIRDFYRSLFATWQGVSVFGGENDEEDNFWLTSVLIDPVAAGWKAEDLRLWLAQDDIESRPLWKPMHLQPMFSSSRALVNSASQTLFETGLTLPSGSALTKGQLERIRSQIDSFQRTT
jgi:dTDP-4-amino-4,6-dideoxygalactose transaminase